LKLDVDANTKGRHDSIKPCEQAEKLGLKSLDWTETNATLSINGFQLAIQR